MSEAVAPRTRDLIVVRASPGGAEALRFFVAGLPADLPAAVLRRYLTAGPLPGGEAEVVP